MDKNDSEKKAKEIRRNTAACEVCQERKRKCDGKAPCSFCVSKNLTCKFTQQKKRGPSKKRKLDASKDSVEESSSPLVAAVTEAEMVDRVEAARYLTLYFRIEHALIPAQNLETLLYPRTHAQKVQLYSALAYSAQAVGDFRKGDTFISHARKYSGAIYDSADSDTVRGLMMMRKYWYIVLDFAQCTHYASLSWSLAKLIKGPNLDYKIRRYCQLCATMSDPAITNRDKVSYLHRTSASLKDEVPYQKADILLERYLQLTADFIEYFDFNILYPSEDIEAMRTFHELKCPHLSEDIRLRMLETINIIQAHLTTFKVEEYTHLAIIARVFCPMYQAVVNWKSGHISEALTRAMDCVYSCNLLKTVNILPLVAGFTHIVMMGCMYQFLREQGQVLLSEQVEQAVDTICRARGPSYDPIRVLFAEYKQNAHTKPCSVPACDPPSGFLFTPLQVAASLLIDPSSPRTPPSPFVSPNSPSSTSILSSSTLSSSTLSSSTLSSSTPISTPTFTDPLSIITTAGTPSVTSSILCASRLFYYDNYKSTDTKLREEPKISVLDDWLDGDSTNFNNIIGTLPAPASMGDYERSTTHEINDVTITDAQPITPNNVEISNATNPGSYQNFEYPCNSNINSNTTSNNTNNTGIYTTNYSTTTDYSNFSYSNTVTYSEGITPNTTNPEINFNTLNVSTFQTENSMDSFVANPFANPDGNVFDALTIIDIKDVVRYCHNNNDTDSCSQPPSFSGTI